ncbi:MAG: hypothetical protein JJU05_12570 [Verrucomicrobia bacterium]|nr:hypothetical protein [Verrucomicrobiota bacterium]MCH8528395.1 hypothetical protein [Kiritimatiellia bacterium]
MSSDFDFRNSQSAEKALLAAILLFVGAGVYVLLSREPNEDPPLSRSGETEERFRGGGLSGFEQEQEGPLLRHNLFVSESQARWRPDPAALLVEEPDPVRDDLLDLVEEIILPPEPPPPPPPPPEPPPEPRRIEVRYAGVVHRLDGRRRALLDVRPSGGQILLEVGDSFEGFQVEGIHRDHLSLERNGALTPLPLNTATILEAP